MINQSGSFDSPSAGGMREVYKPKIEGGGGSRTYKYGTALCSVSSSEESHTCLNDTILEVTLILISLMISI